MSNNVWTGPRNPNPRVGEPDVQTVPATPVPAVDPQQSSAKAIIGQMLDQWGLGGLAQMAWDMITKDSTTDEITYAIRQTDQYKQRFAGNVARQKAGYTPLSEAEYLATEQTYRQVARSAGLPTSFYDSPEDYANFIAKDVSPTEFRDRVAAAQTVAQAEPEDQRALAAYYGVTPGQMTAYFLDPDKSLPILQRQVSAAQLGGTAQRAGMNLTENQANRLAALGVTQDQAGSGFSQIIQAQQLLSALPGEGNTSTISQDQALGATFGNDAAAQQALSRRAKARQAEFAGGGSFAAGAAGYSGAGTAR